MTDSLRQSTVADVGLRHPVRMPFERWPNGTDVVIALVAFLLTIVLWMSRDELDMNTFTGVGSWLTGFVASFALLWRRSHATLTHAVVLGASVLVSVTPLANGIVALVVTLYSVGRYEAKAKVSLVAVSAAFVYLVLDMRLITAPSVGDTIAAGLAVGLWYLGRRLRFRGEYLRLLEERAQHLKREQHVEAERAVAAERTRIAREMHDVVAHQVSLMTVQAGAARTVTRSDPDAAGDAMAAVESAGRQALTEMRGLLGVLRPADGTHALTPQPGLSDMRTLVQQVRRAGPAVSLATTGDLEDLPARYQLTIYRIVQEALTNVIKHAGQPVSVDVSINGGAENIELRVTDNGANATNVATGGHGIGGMRERAALIGGTLNAGPHSDGFEVRATLPRPGRGT